MGNWKSRVMVARYAHLADEELRKAAAKVADLVDVRSAKKAVKTEQETSKAGSE